MIQRHSALSSRRRAPALLALVSVAALTISACDTRFETHVDAAPLRATMQPASGGTTTSAHVATRDAVVPAFRIDLLERAFDAASALPFKPHVKDRSRAQEEVVVACLTLDLPQHAERYAADIVDWRRSASYARIALHAAQRADVPEFERLTQLALAHEPARADLESDEGQAWRRDRVRATLAQACLVLGRSAEAARYASELDEGEAALAAARTADRTLEAVSSAEDLDLQLTQLAAVVATGSFDHVRGAATTAIALAARFHDDAQSLDRIEQLLERAWKKLPLDVRVELSLELVDALLAQDERALALARVDATQALIEGAEWLPQHEAALSASVAVRRFRCGDEDGARRELDAAAVLFEKGRARIVDIDRAQPLRAFAEAACAFGDVERARTFAARALEAGFENPNSRPRARDLTATCLSMAVHGIEPDAALRERLRELRGKLAAPW